MQSSCSFGIGYSGLWPVLSVSACFTRSSPSVPFSHPDGSWPATWQTTILATPLVLLAFGRRIPLKALALTVIIFVGVVLVNLEQASATGWREMLLGALPVLVAAFAYPFGNQLVWEARRGEKSFVPSIDHPAMDDPFCRVLLLTFGSLPLWVILIAVTMPPLPSTGQVTQGLLSSHCAPA